MPRSAIFTLTVDPVTQGNLVAKYETRDGSAKAGVDYLTTAGTVIFEAGDTQKKVSVPVFFQSKGGDFYLDVGWVDPSGKTVNRSTGMACIEYDFGPGNEGVYGDDGYGSLGDGGGGDGSDGIPSTPGGLSYLSVSDGTLVGETTARFVLSISPVPKAPVNVSYGTQDGTAAAGTDYAQRSGTVLFDVGEPANVIDVPILVPGSTKEFYLNTNWSLPSATKVLARGQGKMIIPYVEPSVPPHIYMTSALDWIYTANITIPLPAGDPGDLLIVTLAHAFSGGEYTPPAGWIMQHQYIGRECLAVAYKIRAANEPNPTFTRASYTYGIWFAYNVYARNRALPSVLDASNHQSITTAQASYIVAGITTSKAPTFLMMITCARLYDTTLITNNIGPDSSTVPKMAFSSKIVDQQFNDNQWDQMGGAYNTGQPLIYRAYGGLWTGQGPTGQVAYPSPGGNTQSTSFLLAFKTP
jgi:hypothetical protein